MPKKNKQILCLSEPTATLIVFRESNGLMNEVFSEILANPASIRKSSSYYF